MKKVARILLTVLRVAVPLVLLAGGIVSLGYGVARHTAVVSEEREIEIDLVPPPQVGPPGGAGVGPPGFGPQPGSFGPSGQGFGDPTLAGVPPWISPPPGLAKVKEKVIISQPATELVLIREVTFGGVVRLSSGVLRRTYSGAPPLLCPT